MNKYKLSIIIPAYNTAHYLERTLNTLVNQNLNNYEIIVINDNSNDNTEKIVEKFKEFNAHIKYIKNNINCGQGISRNKGIDIAQGEFITFLDSDDWPDLSTYKVATETLDLNHDCSFIIWGIKNEYNNKISSIIRTDYKTYSVINKNLAMSLLCNTYSLELNISSYLGNKMFRSDYLKKINLKFENILFEDVVFSFKSILYSEKIILLPNVYTHYYQRPNSIVHSFTKKHILDMFQAIKYIKEIVDKDFKEYNNDFMALVDKTSKTLFKLLYANIDDTNEQKELLCFYFEELLNLFTIEKILNYMDPTRIKNILLNN